mmetsp:Transcript_47840/g.107803  ORF Transcript_47840/g.107803 Transcript_47840/m.107803 type:complete len:105 (-) Transcript_47840:64-378(-)
MEWLETIQLAELSLWYGYVLVFDTFDALHEDQRRRGLLLASPPSSAFTRPRQHMVRSLARGVALGEKARWRLHAAGPGSMENNISHADGCIALCDAISTNTALP